VSNLLKSDGPGGSMIRSVLPPATALLVLIGVLRWQGERMGLYGTAVGIALTTVAALAVVVGLMCFFRGLFKKVAVADVVAQFATPVFTAAEAGVPVGFVDGWVGAIAYSLQLYYDFSGYSDMAIGLAWMFNLRLPLNFDTPYRSASIVEFWRRWHISLSRFLRDYLYVALGKMGNG